MTEGTKKSTVLLVEDDSDQRRRIKGELENAGLTVTEAEDEESARRVLDRQQFDIVVSDMWMKQPDGGLKIVQGGQLDSLYYPGLDTVFIVYTAFPAYAHCVATMRAGAYDYVSKLEDGAIDHLIGSCKEGLAAKKKWASDPDAEYVQTKRKQLRQTYGEAWIAVIGQEVIANGKSLDELYLKLRDEFPRARPYIVHL